MFLVFYGTSTQDMGHFVPSARGEYWLLQLMKANNEQRHITVKMQIIMQRQTTGMPYKLKNKQCIQQITRPRMDKNAKWRATTSLSIAHYYVTAFTTTRLH